MQAEKDKMGKRKITDEKDFLFKCILSLNTVEECYDLFEDLCTSKEIDDMSKRMSAAKMLSGGAVYTEVVEKTGLSTATISRVNRCLKEGSDGYTSVLDKMKNQL